MSPRARSRRRACAPTQSCAACSSRTPTPIVPSTPRRRGLDGRERAFAMALAYGTVQRRRRWTTSSPALTVRPLLDPPVLAALRLGLFQCCCSTASPSTPPCTSGSSWPSTTAVAAPDWSTPSCAAPSARAVRSWPAGRRQPRARRRLHSVPQWLAELWWRSSARTAGGRCWRRTTGRGSRRARGTLSATQSNRRSGSSGSPLVPPRAGGSEADSRGAGAQAPFDAFGSVFVGRGALMPVARPRCWSPRRPGSRGPAAHALDLCAGSSTGTTRIAALMGDGGGIQ